jgi:hypothetical protein
MILQHPIQPPCLVGISLHAILDALWGIAHKVVGLALHGTQSSVLKEDPVVYLVVLACACRVGDLVLGLVILLDEVLEDTTGLEDADGLTIAEGVCDGRNAAIGVDF